MAVKLNDHEKAVLKVLGKGREDFGYFGFAYICEETELPRNRVRIICRRLARKGLAQYGRGLFNEDGKMAGAGYAATADGVAWFIGVL